MPFLPAVPLLIPSVALLRLIGAASAAEIPFERYELGNGLQVVLVQDHSLPQVVVDTWYRVGSGNEQAGRSGFAHLFEHLMFMGTHRLPGSGIDNLMEANGGWNNAWTMEDATNYYDVGPPALLSNLLWIEADRMQQLGQAMTTEKLDLQRDVVKNERRQSYEDEPYAIGQLEVPLLMYPKGHPYDHTVIGTHEDLTAASVEDVKAFFATWYVPNNASLVVAGDFDPALVKPLIEQYFGTIEKKPLPALPVPAGVDRAQTARLTLTDDVDYPQINLYFHTPSSFAPGDAEVQLAGSLLADGESSRLYKKLVIGGLAQDVSAYQMPTMYGSLFVISATAADGGTVAAMESAIAAELLDLERNPPSGSEMERVHNQFDYGFLDNLQSLQNRAVQLNQYWAYTGSPDYLAKDLARFQDATPEAIRDATARWLRPELAGVVVIEPRPKGPPAPPAASPVGGAK
ncbi:MAG: insulinase family protein [Myxococcales bacterium]|nr:insulinase family protein [Myxococcales bacterium]